MPAWIKYRQDWLRWLLVLLFGVPLALMWRSLAATCGPVSLGQSFIGPFIVVSASFHWANIVADRVEKARRKQGPGGISP